MNTAKLQSKTQAVIDEYIKDLDHYTMEQLLAKPSDNEWSIGQVYIHVCMSAKGFFFKKAEQCLTKEGAEQGKNRNWKGHLVFLMGKMPNVKVKMPTKVAVEPNQPESKEQLIRKLNEIKELSSAYISKIPQADPSYKTKHPIFDYLNTGEWISLCNMHFRHHEEQKIRIKTHFGW